MVGQDALPDFPTPILLTDNNGESKWTVSIPPGTNFPLSMEQYAEMSGQCREVSSRARDLHRKAPVSEHEILNYDAPDDNFVDVYEAERSGLLAPGKGFFAKNKGQFVGLDENQMKYKPVCESSMTFILETPDAGLGNTLMMLWTFYGLAKEQGRGFFIDDSKWAYGSYTEIFATPPMPDCRPPPGHHMVPCPFQARHLVVSALTAKEVFPALLAKHHRLAGTDDGLHDVFQLANAGYRDLSTLNKDDQAYVDNRVKGLQAKAKNGDSPTAHSPIVGMHIRHGDQHPIEFQYRDSYIPAEIYLQRAGLLVQEHYNASGITDQSQHHHTTIVASDDPTLREEHQFENIIASQDRIRLASKMAIQEANKHPQMLHNFVDETFGWEGGFFSPMFWNLGVSRKNNAAEAPVGVKVEDVNEEARHMAPPSKETLRLRSLVGRAYMMDLVVLAESSDMIVCAVSAMGCRLLAVMMGWEDGIEKGGWVNVDGSYGWTGINW